MTRIHPSVFNLYTMPESVEPDRMSIDRMHQELDPAPAWPELYREHEGDDFAALWEGRQ